eukprot:487333-Prymnesium_polylepis.1
MRLGATGCGWAGGRGAAHREPDRFFSLRSRRLKLGPSSSSDPGLPPRTSRAWRKRSSIIATSRCACRWPA